MENRVGKIFTIALINIILFLPIILRVIPLKFDMELAGVTLNKELPQITLSQAMDGSYQQSIEEYFSQNINGRGIIIKSGNQLIYTIFNQSPHSGEAIGKNNQLYELEYIYKKLQYIPPVTDDYASDLINKLQLLQQKLEGKGTHLFIYITPSKAEIYPEDISDIYYRCAPEKQESSYEKFAKGISNAGLPFFDAAKYVQNMKLSTGEDIYYKTGTHWSQVTGAKVARQLIQEMEVQLGYDLTEIEVAEQEVEEPLAPDADIFYLMNIMQKPYDKYYQPLITVSKVGKQQPSLICRGGSFMGQSITWLINNDIVSDAVHMENTYIFQNKYSDVQSFSDYSEVDIGQLMKNKDILILEVNQAAIEKMSFGFIDYLLDSDTLK